MTKTKAKQVRPHNAWWCDTCKTKELTFPKMKEHLKEVHKLDIEGLKCSRKLLMHLDGAEWFQSQYGVTINANGQDIQLLNDLLFKRDKFDMMRHA